MKCLSVFCLISLFACSRAPADDAESVAALAPSPSPLPAVANGGEQSDAPRLVISPDDLSTAVRETTPAVLVWTRHLTEEQIEVIRRSLSLVTWPDGESIPSQVKYSPPQPSLNVFVHRFDVLSDQAPEKGWLALRVEARELEGYRIVGHPHQGAFVSRFRADHFPILTHVNLTLAEKEKEIGVTVDFSERVVAQSPASEAVRVLVDGAVVDCKPAPVGDVANERERAESDPLRGDQGAPAIMLTCPLFDTKAPLVIKLSPSLRSLGGAPVEVPFGESKAELRFESAETLFESLANERLNAAL